MTLMSSWCLMIPTCLRRELMLLLGVILMVRRVRTGLALIFLLIRRTAYLSIWMLQVRVL